MLLREVIVENYFYHWIASISGLDGSCSNISLEVWPKQRVQRPYYKVPLQINKQSTTITLLEGGISSPRFPHYKSLKVWLLHVWKIAVSSRWFPFPAAKFLVLCGGVRIYQGVASVLPVALQPGGNAPLTSTWPGDSPRSKVPVIVSCDGDTCGAAESNNKGGEPHGASISAGDK